MTTEERLARLERENRWMKLGGGVLLLALVAVLFVGAGQEKDKPKVLEEVRARKISVVDDAGKMRVGIAFQDESPVVGIWDRNDKLRISLTVTSDGPFLILGDEKERARMTFLVDAKGPSIWLVDPKDRVLFKAPM